MSRKIQPQTGYFCLYQCNLMQGIFSQSMTDSSCNALYTQYITPVHQFCVTKTVGCGKNHKSTNIYNFYSVKYYKHFTK